MGRGRIAGEELPNGMENTINLVDLKAPSETVGGLEGLGGEGGKGKGGGGYRSVANSSVTLAESSSTFFFFGRPVTNLRSSSVANTQ